MNLETIKKALKKYGGKVVVTTPYGNYEGKCFIQPLRYKNKMYLGDTYLPAGCYDGGHYLYIGECSVRLDVMDTRAVLKFKSDHYTVKRAELYTVGGQEFYVWAVICKCDDVYPFA